MSARFRLKEATAAAHGRVDDAFAGYDLSDGTGYGPFLEAQAASLIPLEAALTAAGADRLVEQWAEHRRAPLLEADLAALGIALPAPLAPPPISDDAELAGALYVLEGSRLGGAVLARRVLPDLPGTFLNACQAPGRWTRFAKSLDQLLDTPAKLEPAIATALAVFAMFEKAARQAA